MRSHGPPDSGPPIPLSEQGPVFRRLLGMLRPYRAMIGLALVLLILSMPCELFPAFIWQYVTDDLILKGFSQPSGLQPMMSLGERIHGAVHLLVAALAWMYLIYGIGEITGTLSTIIMQRTAQKFVFLLRNKVYDRLQNQSMGYLQLQRTGDLMSRAIGDVDEIQSFVVNSIDQVVGDGGLWIAAVAVVLWKSWQVASVSMLPLMTVLVMLIIFNRKVRPIYAAARQRAGDVNTRLQENLSGISVIKIFGREKEEARRFEQSTWAYYLQQVKAITARNIYFPATRAVGFFSNVFMLGVGGYLILKYPHGAFTVGTLLLFRAYWWRLFGPVQTLARVNDMVQRGGAASRRVFEVLDAPEELPDAPDALAIENIRGEMQLADVSFRYPGDAGAKLPIVLENVNIRIEPNHTVALCGPSGAGKSTVLNLLLRFYDPTQGQVLLDGRDLRSIRRDSFRGHFALVQQETFLFNDSVLDNIRYGHSEATMEQVIAAAKAANAHGFISRLPSGYDTKVGERGVRLSGGQKQRISIARAFLANPAVLLLDEPTSSVEPDSEATIIAALDRLMAGRTTVLTSHRPSLINQADLVYVIEDGRVSDSGSPQELLARGGWFARFIQSAEETDEEKNLSHR
jgi:ABC-type multidrug transport system fused ATPase/permease subunit